MVSPVVNIVAGSVMSWGEMGMKQDYCVFLVHEFVLVCERA